MDMNSVNIEEIVKQVLQGMTGQSVQSSVAPAPKATGAIPKTARVAMLTGIEKIELQEYPIPEIGDGDILVKVENEMKKEFGELNAAAEVIEIDEKEFVRFINQFKLKDELLKEIANSINKLGDASVYNYAKNIMLVNF